MATYFTVLGSAGQTSQISLSVSVNWCTHLNNIKKFKKRLLQILIGLLILYLVLLIPDSNNTTIINATEKPFIWNKDVVWLQLENDFENAQLQPKGKIDSTIRGLFSLEELLFNKIQKVNIPFTDSNYVAISNTFFFLASLVAAQPPHRDSFVNLYNKIRSNIKLTISRMGYLSKRSPQSPLPAIVWNAGRCGGGFVANG